MVYLKAIFSLIRLKSWMTEASEPCRSELSQVLFPLFVHLYLELLTGAGKQAARIFFSRHHQVTMVNYLFLIIIIYF